MDDDPSPDRHAAADRTWTSSRRGCAIEPDTLVPERMPDLFASSPLLVLGRYRGPRRGPRSPSRREPGGGAWSEAVAVRVRENPAIASAWARGQVRKLEDRYIAGTGHDLDALERQIVSVSLRFGVLSRFTAYVAIDRSAVTGATSKLHRITQPVESPEGWAMCAAAAAPDTLLDQILCATRPRLSESLTCSAPLLPPAYLAQDPKATRRFGRGLAPRGSAGATPPSPGHPASDETEELPDPPRVDRSRSARSLHQSDVHREGEFRKHLRVLRSQPERERACRDAAAFVRSGRETSLRRGRFCPG